MTKKKMSWISAGAEHTTSFMEFFYTREGIDAVKEFSAVAGRTLIGHSELPNGELFVMSGHIEPWGGQEMVVPASFGNRHDMVISASDPENTGRPIRLTIFKDATSTSPVTIVEYGGYQVPAGMGWREGMGTFTRNLIIDRSKDSTL